MNSEDIPVPLLIAVALIPAFIFILVSVANAAPVPCFEKAFYSESVKEVKPRRKLHRTDLGCGANFSCLFERAPLGSDSLNIYLDRNLRNRVTAGTLGGWAEKSVASIRAGSKREGVIKINRRIRARIRNALEIARGIEVQSLIERPELIYGDLDFYARITAENNCDERRNGLDLDAFYSFVRVPLKGWADIRHEEGWFDRDFYSTGEYLNRRDL